MDRRGRHDLEVEALWRDIAEPLRGFIARRVATPEDADDIVQDVFVRVASRLDGLRDDERIVGWVYRIARNAVIDHYRAAPRRRELAVGAMGVDALEDAAAGEAVDGDAAAGDTGGWPFDAAPDAAVATRRELVACLRPALASLPPAAREALELTELGDLTQAEAAAQLGISVSGMKSRVQRARRQVRSLIEDCCALVFDGRGAPIERRCRTGCCAA